MKKVLTVLMTIVTLTCCVESISAQNLGKQESLIFYGDPFYLYEKNFDKTQMLNFLKQQQGIEVLKHGESSIEFKYLGGSDAGIDWFTGIPDNVFTTTLWYHDNKLESIVINDVKSNEGNIYRYGAQTIQWLTDLTGFEPVNTYKNNSAKGGAIVNTYKWEWSKYKYVITVQTNSWSQVTTGWFRIFIEPLNK